MRHDRHLVKETRIVVEKSTINSILLGPNSLLFFFLFFFFFFFLSVYSPRLRWYYTCGSHPSGFQEASKGIWCYNVCPALDCSFVCLINGLKYGKTGNKKCVTCFATLLQNELNSDVARFTTHIKPVLQQIRLLCIGQIEASTSPPGNPPGIWRFWKLLFKFPPTRAKMTFKCPTLGSIQVIECPHPGDISQAQKWQEDGRNAFICRTKSL